MTNRLFKGIPIRDLPPLTGTLGDLVIPASKDNQTGRFTLQTLIDYILDQVDGGTSSPVADVVPILGSVINLDGGNNSYFTKEITEPISFVIANPPESGKAFAFTVELETTTIDVTWPSQVIWPGNVVPVFSAGKTSLLTFSTRDGGAQWRGSARLNYGEGPPIGQESWDNGASWDGGAFWV